MRHDFVPPSSARSVYVPAGTPSKEKKGGKGGLVIGILVLLVVGGIAVYLATRPKVNSPDVSNSIWERYTAEPERDDMPTSDDIRQKTSVCLAGFPGTGNVGAENPGYASTDRLGRATAAWVCIGADKTEVAPKPCNYPTGTTQATYRGSWVQGHLVSFRLGGDGTRRDNGGCQNVTPQTGSVNKKISDGPEAYAKVNTKIFYIAIPNYRSDDSLSPVEAAKPNYLYYFIFTDAGAPIQAWLFENIGTETTGGQ